MSKMPLIEQETIITFNAEEGFAEIYSCHPSQIRKLDKLCKDNPEDWKVLRADQIGKVYTCPKELISLRSKRNKKAISSTSLNNLKRGTSQ